ncbi:hypothetical protein J2Y58_004119 [Sphingomonas sp. BE138]|uniref:hypothetical protein n=1 Tax=Sphingomonas sp. BE138 TaxID=2817845 RepID=UPI00285AD4B0|nr:hypothetical protein [Sphingomonas sp. BE138]MDR6790736.1 hypothetical protein [Sphingomonas sp. BE138]
MTPGATDTVPWCDRLLARFEVSRFAVVPFSISLFAAPVSWLILSLALFGGRRSVIIAVVLLVIWAVPVGLDQARGWWLWRHPHASPRWLRAVRAATGDAVFDEALAHLTILHGDDPGYRVERAHLANAVQVAWNARRKARQRDEGVCLGDAPGQA